MPENSTERLDPNRNVQNAEILKILEKPYFGKPDRFSDEQWSTAVQQVRDALGKLSIDFGVNRNYKHLIKDSCRKVDEMAESSDVPNELLQDPVVNAVRVRIGFFLRMRIYILGHEDYEKLYKLIREKSGNVSVKDFRKCSLKLILIMHKIIIDNIGNTQEAKRKGWTLISEFLSEQTGVQITLQLPVRRDTDKGEEATTSVPIQTGDESRDPTGGGVEADADGVDVTKDTPGMSDATVVLDEKIKGLPRGVSPRAYNIAGRHCDKMLASYRDSLKDAIEKIDLQIAEIEKMIREIKDGEKKKLETDMIPVAAKLQEYDEARKKIEDAFDDLLESLQVFEDRAALSKADKKRREKQLKALDDEHAPALRRRAEFQDKLDAIQPKIDALEEKRTRLLGERTRLSKISSVLFDKKNDPNAVSGAGGEEVMTEDLRRTGSGGASGDVATRAAGSAFHAASHPTGAEKGAETAKPILTLKELIDRYAGQPRVIYGYARNEVIARALNKDVLGLKDDAKGAVKVGGFVLIIVHLVPRQTAVTLSHLSNPGRRSNPIDNDGDVGKYNLFTKNPLAK